MNNFYHQRLPSDVVVSVYFVISLGRSVLISRMIADKAILKVRNIFSSSVSSLFAQTLSAGGVSLLLRDVISTIP